VAFATSAFAAPLLIQQGSRPLANSFLHACKFLFALPAVFYTSRPLRGFCFSRISLKFRLIGAVSAPRTSNGTSNGGLHLGRLHRERVLSVFQPRERKFAGCIRLRFGRHALIALDLHWKICPRITIEIDDRAGKLSFLRGAARVAKNPSIPNARIAASAVRLRPFSPCPILLFL